MIQLRFITTEGKCFVWDNWAGEVPQIGDHVIDYPEGAEESTRYEVIDRWMCNRQPEQVRYIVKEDEE